MLPTTLLPTDFCLSVIYQKNAITDGFLQLPTNIGRQ